MKLDCVRQLKISQPVNTDTFDICSFDNARIVFDVTPLSYNIASIIKDSIYIQTPVSSWSEGCDPHTRLQQIIKPNSSHSLCPYIIDAYCLQSIRMI